MEAIAELARRFVIPQVRFRELADGLPAAEVENDLASASVSLQGGHVLTWRPKPEAEAVVWLSPLAKFARGKSIRGGVPICWPWFGPHETNPELPAHGFARTVPWELTAVEALSDGSTALDLTLVQDEKTRAQWSYPSRLSIRVVVGRHLGVSLTTTNLGDRAFEIGEALHTYLGVGDIGAARILGLDGGEYVDKVGETVRRRQRGPVTFAGETDRVYVDTEADCVVEDPRLGRRIRVAKSGSRSTVVWNPWVAKADRMGDFGPDGWRRMVCVESANALENTVTVPAGKSHTLSVQYRVER
jgi:D-hexose-6-phosphate mutarotase